MLRKKMDQLVKIISEYVEKERKICVFTDSTNIHVFSDLSISILPQDEPLFIVSFSERQEDTIATITRLNAKDELDEYQIDTSMPDESISSSLIKIIDESEQALSSFTTETLTMLFGENFKTGKPTYGEEEYCYMDPIKDDDEDDENLQAGAPFSIDTEELSTLVDDPFDNLDTKDEKDTSE